MYDSKYLVPAFQGTILNDILIQETSKCTDYLILKDKEFNPQDLDLKSVCYFCIRSAAFYISHIIQNEKKQ